MPTTTSTNTPNIGAEESLRSAFKSVPVISDLQQFNHALSDQSVSKGAERSAMPPRDVDK